MRKRPLLFAVPGLIALVLAANSPSSLLHAAETPRSTPPPVAPVRPSYYDLEIVNGELHLANLKGQIDAAKWGAGNQTKVEASLRNVVDVLRELHPAVNITMAPGIERLVISNLKLRSTGLPNELDALSIASGSRFAWTQRNSAGDANNTSPIPLFVLVPNGRSGEGSRGVEVFNLSQYFQQLGERDKKEKDENLKVIQEIIQVTLEGMNVFENEGDMTFRFHPGANLLVATGGPQSLEVARKVIGALQAQAAEPGGSAPNDFGTPGGFAAGGFGGSGDDANPFGGMSKGRRQILDKLQGIRLESVRYEKLPLSEIVRSLAEESKKRDPEKRGLNFMVHTTPGPAGSGIDPSTGLPIPSSPANVNEIAITISPALNNVRILDVLDAMVRSADRPIRYSITDYAVVFSLKSTRPVPAYGGSPGTPGGR